MKHKYNHTKQMEAVLGTTTPGAATTPQNQPQSIEAHNNLKIPPAVPVSKEPAGESPGKASKDQNPVAPFKPHDSSVTETYLRKTRWYYEQERSQFLPIKPPAGWNEKDDIQGFNEAWGESDDHRREIEVRFQESIAKVHTVLKAGINYFCKDREARPVMPPSVLTLREKVELFTEVLPRSPDDSYTLRFTMTLAWLLWLESERVRLMEHPVNHQWLFPFYRLADSLMAAALELEESLRCEHDDFDESGVLEEDDD
jgi:hypothetical protein